MKRQLLHKRRELGIEKLV